MKDNKDNACGEMAQIAINAQSGTITNMEAWAYLKEIEGVLKMAMTQVKDSALKEAAGYEENTFIEGEYEYTKKAGAKRFDFKKIHEWKEAKEALTEVEAKYKLVYQNHEKGLDTVNGDEVMQVPVVMFNAPSLLVTQL
jgi:hypothetical protein